MATQISSTFQIVTDLAAGQGITNIATSRSMRVVSIQGTGLTTATILVAKVSSAGVATAMGTVAMDGQAGQVGTSLSDQYAVMTTLAASTMLQSDTIRITRAVANSTRIVLNCVAASGEVLTES